MDFLDKFVFTPNSGLLPARASMLLDPLFTVRKISDATGLIQALIGSKRRLPPESVDWLLGFFFKSPSIA